MIKITADSLPDSWKEVCLVGILIDGGSEVQFAALTEDITAMDWADKEVEGKALINGGRVCTFTPGTEESMTLKVYPVSALLTGTGVVQHFHPQSADDAAQAILVDNSLTRKKHKVILTWATQLPATAGAVSTANACEYRIQIINAYMTRYKPSFDGKTFTAEISFKWTPFTKAAAANKREESSDGTVQIPVVTASATAF